MIAPIRVASTRHRLSTLVQGLPTSTTSGCEPPRQTISRVTPSYLPGADSDPAGSASALLTASRWPRFWPITSRSNGVRMITVPS